MRPWQKFEVSEAMAQGLARKLETKEEIFSFRSDPLLASLVSCLGLQFELGKPEQDRASFFLGVDLANTAGNPWKSEIIALGDQLGLRAWIPGREELAPLHEDFRLLLHPLSMVNGRLAQLVIFPMQVAEAYGARGIELVVVRDWALTAFLSRNRNLNYQKTNKEEIEGHITLTQLQLMRNRQLAFTGTHDLGDHLLGGYSDGIGASDALRADIEHVYAKVFNGGGPPRRSALVVSYLIAVLLDDLVQPQWYASPGHALVARRALALMEVLEMRADIPEIFLPQSFHVLVELLRGRAPFSELERGFLRFGIDLQAQQFTAGVPAVANAL
jgi:hypothetical protein